MNRYQPLSVLAAAALALTALIGTAGPAAAASTTRASEARVLTLVNKARATAGCGALKDRAQLTKAARTHSQDMAKRGYFAYNTLEGVTPWTRIAKAGYPKAALAENIAAGQTTADAVVKAWLNSPGHRKNILNCSMKSVGTGLATGGPYAYYWTQDFGSR